MTDRYALTLGEQSEIHVGCTIYGDGLAAKGFSVEELEKIGLAYGDKARLVVLSNGLPEEKRAGNEAAVLHIKGGINALMESTSYADRMLAEQKSVKYDEFYFDRRRQKKLHKVARHNAVFGNAHVDASEDYKQSTVIAYEEVPLFEKLRGKLASAFGEKAKNLQSEGNHYYNHKTGIGFHGDCERKIVICCSLGTATTLRFYWRVPGSSDIGSQLFDFKVEHGDMYLMSEKATGHDWRMRSHYRLVHGAGALQYVVPKKPKAKGQKRKVEEALSESEE